VSGAHRFARLGVRRDEDLVWHLPLRYEDETQVIPIGELRTGQTAQVAGTVVRNEVVPRPRRMLVVEIDDGSGTLTLRFLNFYGSQVAQLAVGRRVRAHGEPRTSLFGVEMVHPRYRMVGADDRLPTRLTPVYPTVAGIGQAALRKAVLEAVATARSEDTLLPGTAARLGLPPLDEALALLHQPPAGVPMSALEDRSHPAWRRVIFEELLAQQLSLRRARAARAGQRSAPLADVARAAALLAALPFRLTGAQQRAWAEVSADLGRDVPMNRLLQGDVGSGKTVVAALAALQAVGSGRQAALMAPTEILAEQHWRKLTGWLEPLGVRIAWLAGSLKESDKKSVRAAAAAGEVDLLVGTHALVEESVSLPRLGLAIVDEQHRFGVAQRLALRAGRGEALPHQLMMSATPIPRTLAMSYYADLDVSVIDELPPGRTPVVTKLVAQSRRDEVIERVRAAAAGGRQVYWVCPLIEESEALDLQTAMDTYEALADELSGLRVGLVHGRMASADKAAAMAAFTGGDTDVLVTTTVIEVGVDVPNASLMVIEHAERFGLAQLHQLRGRVGRGTADSVCVLLYRPPLSEGARERLRVMYETTDGFEIARRDLQLRGPGEFLGARQSGTALLRFADLDRDADLVEAARDEAARMLATDPLRVDAHLERWLAGREEFLKA
jgi:ATP-dependent DNA helicase RecG